MLTQPNQLVFTLVHSYLLYIFLNLYSLGCVNIQNLLRNRTFGLACGFILTFMSLSRMLSCLEALWWCLWWWWCLPWTAVVKQTSWNHRWWKETSLTWLFYLWFTIVMRTSGFFLWHEHIFKMKIMKIEITVWLFKCSRHWRVNYCTVLGSKIESIDFRSLYCKVQEAQNRGTLHRNSVAKKKQNLCHEV